MGAIHSTQISGLRFENFLGTNGWRRVQSHSIPLLKRVLRSFKLSNVGSLLLVLELDDKFNFAMTLYELFHAEKFYSGYFEQTVHRYVPVEFNDFQTPLSNKKKKHLKLSRETLIGSLQPSKVVHLERWTPFFKTFMFGPSQSIQF